MAIRLNMTVPTFALLISDWLKETGRDKTWRVSPGYPDHIMAYQKPMGWSSSAHNWAYHLIIEDDRVIDTDPNTSDVYYKAADPEFFQKLQKHMRDIELRFE